MPNVLDLLIVFDPDGRPVRLGSLWSDRTVVAVFIRHFGCLFARQQVAALGPLLGPVRDLGGELVVIGQGSVDAARVFRDQERLEVPLLTDPHRKSHCALGLRRGLGSVLTRAVLARAIRARRAGFRQTGAAGDVLQQGGVVVIAAGGEERYRYVSRDAGDHPTSGAILAALTGQQ